MGTWVTGSTIGRLGWVICTNQAVHEGRPASQASRPGMAQRRETSSEGERLPPRIRLPGSGDDDTSAARHVYSSHLKRPPFGADSFELSRNRQRNRP